MTTAIPSRRERLRAGTLDEIKQTARRLLVTEGLAGISLRAIARGMGLTAAALYRYFPNLEALVTALCTDLFDEVRESLERARDACPPDDPAGRMYALCREFRRWSVSHPAEFGLIFGSPLPGREENSTAHPAGDPDADKHAAALRFSSVFAALFIELWQRAPFEVPSAEQLPPSLCEQLREFSTTIGAPLPVGALQVFLSCWIRLYGIVALETFGHLHFALTDSEPMFETELASLARMVGIGPRP